MSTRHGAKPRIIVRKVKRKHHGGHHGGSWKVAYADFVTAMMAFFLVMWILGMDQQLRRAVEGYFSNPVGYKRGFGSGRSPISSGTSPAMVRTNPIQMVSRMRQEEAFRMAQQRIGEALAEAPEVGALRARVETVVTAGGLRIELIEGDPDESLFFALGSAQLRDAGRAALMVIGHELAGLENPVILEGHTDAAQYGIGDYSNWELSSDRANAARRVLQRSGVEQARFHEVKGLADRDLRDPGHPLSPVNRRITITLPFVKPQVIDLSQGAPIATTDSLKFLDH